MRFICIKFDHWANNCGKYVDRFYKPMINNKDGHIPSPLIMFTCTALHHALLEWQKNQGVHLKASKSKLNVDRPDCMNYFNHKNDCGRTTSCCTATDPKLLTSDGLADRYTFLMNTRYTLPESYQQRVYNNTLATVKRQIQQAENSTPAMIIRTETASVDKGIHLDYLISELALEEPEIVSTDPNIPIDNNCLDDELHFGMPWGRRDFEDEGDDSDMRDAILTTCQRRQAATKLERFDLGICDVDGYEGEDGDHSDGHAEEKDEASQADDGLTQNEED
jgi:hypothetical protein